MDQVYSLVIGNLDAPFLDFLAPWIGEFGGHTARNTCTLGKERQRNAKLVSVERAPLERVLIKFMGKVRTHQRANGTLWSLPNNLSI